MDQEPLREPRGWKPTPELLAAYADGELEGRDELARLKGKLETWLAEHPEARAELAAYRRLKRLWRSSSPEDPPAVAWDKVWRHLASVMPPVARERHLPWGLWAGVLAAAAAGIVLFYLNSVGPTSLDEQPSPAEVEAPFLVATSEEVTVIQVGGADTSSLVVGELPVKGPLELVTAGEVSVTSIQPHADNMVPEVRRHTPSGSPMIWARLDGE